MRQRTDIEGDLIQMTARLHDTALGGAGAANLEEMRRLTATITRLTEEAEDVSPQVIPFPMVSH